MVCDRPDDEVVVIPAPEYASIQPVRCLYSLSASMSTLLIRGSTTFEYEDVLPSWVVMDAIDCVACSSVPDNKVGEDITRISVERCRSRNGWHLQLWSTSKPYLQRLMTAAESPIEATQMGRGSTTVAVVDLTPPPPPSLLLEDHKPATPSPSPLSCPPLDILRGDGGTEGSGEGGWRVLPAVVVVVWRGGDNVGNDSGETAILCPILL